MIVGCSLVFRLSQLFRKLDRLFGYTISQLVQNKQKLTKQSLESSNNCKKTEYCLEEMPINIKRKVPTKQYCVTYHQDVGDEAILCQRCSMQEYRICASVSVKEYDILSNNCNKIMFSALCAVLKCHYIALKLEDKNSSLTLEWENIHKAIPDYPLKQKISVHQKKNCKRTSKKLQLHTLSSMQPYNVVSGSSCSMAVDIVRELEDKEHHKNNVIFSIMFLNPLL